MGEDVISLQKMQITSWVYLVVMVIGSVLASMVEGLSDVFSLSFALSVFVGGVISIISFWASHTDVIKFVTNLTETSDVEERKEKAKKGKGHYLLRFWIRIAIIGVVLLLLIKSGMLNIFGLVLGLSTVVFTVTLTAFSVARHYFFSGRR